MKFAVVILAVVGVASAALQPFSFATKPPPAPFRFRPIGSPAPPPPVYVKPVAPSPLVPVVRPVVKVSQESLAQTLRSEDNVNPDGSFSYLFETDNGISTQAHGVPRTFPGNPPVSPVIIEGSFSWPNPQGGEPIVITYIADQDGYHPSGNAIPTPPPVPPQIARALAYTQNRL